MSINPDNFTDKTNEIIKSAHDLALDSSHIQMTPVHLALALLADEEGLATQLFKKAGADINAADRALRKMLVRYGSSRINKNWILIACRLPIQDPAPTEVGMSSQFAQLLRNAIQLQKKQGDSHLAVDHLLLAVAEDKDIMNALGDSGLSKSQLVDTIKQLRGGRKVEGKGAEGQYDALNKYGHDLVADAEAGK